MQGDTVHICVHSRNQACIYFPRAVLWITFSFSSKASNLKVPLAVDNLDSTRPGMITNGAAFPGTKGAIFLFIFLFPEHRAKGMVRTATSWGSLAFCGNQRQRALPC